MTSDSLALISGAVLSLIFSYVPGLSAKWEALDNVTKRLVMLLMLALVAGGVFGLACSGWGADFGVKIACDKEGLVGLVQAFLMAVIANQGAYKITRG